MNRSVLLLGSNLGNREQALQLACSKIEKRAGEIDQSSRIYETEPWGNTVQSSFLNQVLIISTSLQANELLSTLLQIESELGRKRKHKWEPRIIDIDILFFNEEVINSEELIVPHPFLKDRRFALVPLNEVLSSYIHPVIKCSVSDLLELCTDSQQVKLYI